MVQSAIKKKQSSIVEVLKDAILSGDIPCGTEMTQKELAESLGVSRMPVREALIILEYQGLIGRLPNNHVRVTEFSDTYFQEVFSLCARLEEEVLHIGEFAIRETSGTRFSEKEQSEELRIHYGICDKAANALLKKTLYTIIEIYVEFAIRQDTYDRTKGEKLLRQIVSEKDESRRQCLYRQYFKMLEEAIVAEREKRC